MTTGRTLKVVPKGSETASEAAQSMTRGTMTVVHVLRSSGVGRGKSLLLGFFLRERSFLSTFWTSSSTISISSDLTCALMSVQC